jgi:TPR repeat protein
MDQVPEPSPAGAEPAAGAVVRSRWLLPKLPLLIGAIGLGAAVGGGTWFKHRVDARAEAELQAIRSEVADLTAAADDYYARVRSLREQAAEFRGAAARLDDERSAAWARERSRDFDALVARLDRSADEAKFAQMKSAILSACEQRDLQNARELLLKIPELRFPSSARFRELQAELYLKPLVEFSRQNPAAYRELGRHEPAAAREDVAALRQELVASDLDTLTPQSMLKLELYSAVAPPGDPLAEDWASLAAAAEYFDQPDSATLAAWRRAQRAIRREDWDTAVAQMQSILRTTVRTRLPFRAAYARTLLRNRPEDRAAAYPFMQEAAAAGDAAARSWLVDEELRQGNPTQALRWLESGVLAGDATAVMPLLRLYAEPKEKLPRDAAREAGVLQRVLVAPDAPPLAAMLLARLYEEGNGVGASSGQALAYYRRAAERNHVPAMTALARCFLRGRGTAVDKDQAVAWAARAYEAGEREESLPLLLELMQNDPERAAGAVQELFEHEQVGGPSGFANEKIYGPSIAQLQSALGRYYDQKGMFAQAARLYAQSGRRDPAAKARHAALTTGRPCETCHGTGKLHSWVSCPTCDGRGTVVCHVCDGRGYTFVPGTPPCTTCGGSGTLVQNGRRLACGACGGTGKGKGSVVRKDCTVCTQGREPCHDCTGGRIRVTKECPDCHGTGARALADQ